MRVDRLRETQISACRSSSSPVNGAPIAPSGQILPQPAAHDIDASGGADHAQDEAGHDATGGAEPPANGPAECGTDEPRDFAQVVTHFPACSGCRQPIWRLAARRAAVASAPEVQPIRAAAKPPRLCRQPPRVCRDLSHRDQGGPGSLAGEPVRWDCPRYLVGNWDLGTTDNLRAGSPRNMPIERTFTDQEVALILRRAMERQEEGTGRREGLVLRDRCDIAREIGIDLRGPARSWARAVRPEQATGARAYRFPANFTPRHPRHGTVFQWSRAAL